MLMLLTLCGLPVQAEPSASTTIEANLQYTSCTMSFSDSPVRIGDSNGQLNVDSLLNPDVKNVGKKEFSIKLKDCSIWPDDMSKTPGIQLTGPLLDAGNPSVFRNADAKNDKDDKDDKDDKNDKEEKDDNPVSRGFGVQVYRNGQNEKPLNHEEYIDIPNEGKGNFLVGSYEIPLWAAVTCIECTTDKLRTGSLEATLTFTFQYH
jgi:type 1 fimbria pilin